MAGNKNNKSGSKSYIFTRETIGMTLLLFSVVVLFILLTREAVVSNFGKAICTFMYGAFGYGAYFVIALLSYFGVWLVAEKKIKVKASIKLSISAGVIALFLLFHAVTTRNMSLDSFGGYLNANYMSAAEGWSGYTFGGAVCGMLVYPVAKFTTFIGAYVIFSVLFALCAYWAFLMLFKGKLGKSSHKKIERIVEENPDDRLTDPSLIPAADHLYSVNDSQEIVDNRVAEQYVAPVQPAPQPAQQPVYVEQPQPVYVAQPQPEQSDDKFSQRNLGRKILFEKGEFAAESYKRNMIFSGDSYFSRPVKSDGDYLSSFSSNSSAHKAAPKTQSYTQDYQENVINKPVTEIPSSYIYGDKPVQSLDDSNNQPEDTYQDKVKDNNELNIVDTDAQNIRKSEQHEELRTEELNHVVRPERPIEQLRQHEYVEPPVNEIDILGERVRHASPIEEEKPVEQIVPAEPADTSKQEKSTGIISSFFTGDSIRGNGSINVSRGRDERRIVPEEETSKQNIFDDDGDDGEVDLGEDRFGVASRGGFDRVERTDRTDRVQHSDSPASVDRGVGFVAPSTDRQPQPEERVVGFTNPDSEKKNIPAVPSNTEEKPAEKPKHVWQKYVRPPLDLLDDHPEDANSNAEEIEENKRIIVDILENFKIASEISNVTIAPAITRYDVTIFDKTKTRTALGYKNDIALALMKKNVNTYLNYSKGVISIEVPNTKCTIVGLKSMLVSPQFVNAKPSSLTFGLGKNIDGEVVCPDITKMPHLLVAGTTGSGKSVCLNALLISLLYKYGPEDLRLILVDPKQNEFVSYNKLPHLMINEILYDIDKVIKALNWAIQEMERRYQLFKEMSEMGKATSDIGDYNSHVTDSSEKLPKIVIVLDEFGDLMLQAKKDIESKIIRLVQKSRACGIHLILATQRPSVDCITGLIKSNLPTRMAFQVGSYENSRIILDTGGAEKLLGNGDMYYKSPKSTDLVRIQGCLVSPNEKQRVTDFVKEHNETYFDEEATNFINKVEEPEDNGGGDIADDGGDAKIDETYIKALEYCVMSNMASVSMIQRRFPVGYIKACKIIDWMTNMNYITPSEGSKPRKVLISKEEFMNTYGDGNTDD